MDLKKFFATIVFAAVLIAPLAYAQASFTDVSSINPHYVAINSLVEQEILQGYEDGSFLPDQEVNRAEALKIVLLGMGVEINEESTAGVLFGDVSEDDWFYNYVGTAVSMGIVSGYDDNTFQPEETVNRAEAMKMLVLAGGIDVEAVSENFFVDVDVEAWFSKYAYFAKTWNIEPPQADGRWYPGDSVSRANISEMVYRMQLVDENGVAFEESTNWLRKDFPTVDISMKVPFGWNYKQEGVGAVWVLDTENAQMSLLSPYENGGTLLMTRYGNSEKKSADELFSGLEGERSVIAGYDAFVVYRDNGVTFREWYLVMDNGSLVHLLAMRGEGYYSAYLEDYIEAMVVSLEYEPDGEIEMSIEDILESLRSSIQVDGMGAEVMELLDDWELIETDAIGVGTGPVDYFYSPSGNITVKYERSYDVILDIEDGQTSAF